VDRGLHSLRENPRLGLAALMAECSCDCNSINSSAIGFMLAPRINAAGRMGKIDLAVNLLLADNPQEAAALAKALCDLNRQRQGVESEIYDQAVSMLPQGVTPEAIVLADDRWHQGVVGIVASRIAEEFCCPTFLICLDGEHGKASSRSFGGFNLFASLTSLSHLLESYGGHELAAGFTINRQNIDRFRSAICSLAAQYYSMDTPRTTLDIDCAIPPEMLTIPNIEALSAMEPCGNGCPKPVLMMENLVVERLQSVGGGRHLRLRLRRGRYTINAIYFSATAQSASIAQGDLVDVAFQPQVNEFRDERTVQMNIQDIRPACHAECSPELMGYHSLRTGKPERICVQALLPDRNTLATVWRYLASTQDGIIEETPMCLCRKIVRWSNGPLSLGKLMVCLDIFSDVGLLHVLRMNKYLSIRLTPGAGKADLNQSQTMQRLLQMKES